jgi:glyoxylase-like metal-dependent hydrolase (beta-lactamase superfamily II)
MQRRFLPIRLGRLKLTALSDGDFDLPAERLLIGERPGDVSGLLAKAGLPAVVSSAVNAFLIETDDALVLVDAGAGSLQGAGLGRLETSLREAGYAPDRIDAVLLTHLHPDHVGGIARAGRMVFPAATVWADAREAAFWRDGAGRERVDESVRATFDGAASSLGPYVEAGRFRTFMPGDEPVPGVRAIALEGHTAGHAGFCAESGSGRLIACGDVFHVAPVQLAEPRLAIRYDSDPLQAGDARERLLAEAAERGHWLAAAHAPFPGVGRVRREGEGYAWVPWTSTD